MTERNKEADAKFEVALKEYIEANGYGDGLLMEWIVITAQHHSDDDGSSTSLATFVAPQQPLYRSVGLVAYATNKLNRLLTTMGTER